MIHLPTLSFLNLGSYDLQMKIFYLLHPDYHGETDEKSPHLKFMTAEYLTDCSELNSV